MKKVTGNLIQKRDMYYVVLNYPSVNGKRIRKTLSTGLPTKRNETKAKAIMRQMLKAANAGQEVHGVMERTSKEHKPTEDTGPRPDMYFSDYLLFWLQWKRNTWEEVTYASYHTIVASLAAPYFAEKKDTAKPINRIRYPRLLYLYADRPKKQRKHCCSPPRKSSQGPCRRSQTETHSIQPGHGRGPS